MGNSRLEKGKAASPSDDEEEDPGVLQEKLYCARLELQKTLSLSIDADETISRLAAAARRMAKERDEACMKRNALLAELQARRNAQVRMAAALASGSPPAAAAFSCYGNRALVPFGRTTTQQEQQYARAAGTSYCFASSSSRPRRPGQDSFDPDMLLVEAAEGDSAVPATAKTTGSGALGMVGKKKSSGSELSLVAEQMLRVPRKKGEVVEAPVHEEEEEEDDDDDAGTSVEETVSDAGLTEAGDSVDECCGGGGCSLVDVVSSASKKRS